MSLSLSVWSLLIKFTTTEIIACSVLGGVALILLGVLAVLAVRAKKKNGAPQSEKVKQNAESAEEPAEAVAEQAEEPAEAVAEQAEEPAEAVAEQAEEPAEAVAEQAEEPAEAVAEQAEEPAEAVAEQAEEPVEAVAEQAEEPAEVVAEQAEEPAEVIAEQAEEPAEAVAEQTKESAEAVAEKAEEPAEAVAEQAEEPAEAVAEQAEEPAEAVAEQAEEPAEAVAEQAEATEAPVEEEISGENIFVPEEIVRGEDPVEEEAEKFDEKEAEELAGESLVGVVREEVRGEEVLHAYAVRTKQFIAVRYSKSFTAKLIQSEDETKEYYSRLKNELLSYKKVKARMSWKRESFRIGRTLIARLQYRGKKLCLYLALDPKSYEGTKYYVEDVSAVASNAQVPLMYRIKSERRAKYALDLIADVCAKYGEEKKKTYKQTNYAAEYPYDSTESLVERGLVKEIRYKETQEEVRSALEHARDGQTNAEIKASEVKGLMHDEVAAALVVDSVGYSDKSKTAVVNVDTLNEYFAEGERVSLEEMKQKITYLSKKTTYVKILARGSLNKALTVEADDFSLDAIKMIVLAGGTAIRRKAGVELKK